MNQTDGQLNSSGQELMRSLQIAAEHATKQASSAEHAQKVHVTGAGRTLTFAYEQLRNSAEYTEEHLLLQRAVRRFYKRLFFSRDTGRIAASGEELIVELTLAGYLQNDTIAASLVDAINGLAADHFDAYISTGKDEWTLEVLAVEIERLLNDDVKRIVFSQFAHQHFVATLDQKALFAKPLENFEVALFVAVQKMLLKADQATIRAALLRRFQQTPKMPTFEATNQMIDGVFAAVTTERLFRVVDRRGAPLRVLWRLIDEYHDPVQLLSSREQFLSAYETQIATEYAQIDSRINRGIIKSVIFLIITKVIIGVAIEIPFDYLVYGAILWLPLVINLLFPPLYMVLLRFTLQLPGSANTRSLVDAIDDLVYGHDTSLRLSRKSRGQGFGLTFNIVYAVFFLAVFAGASWGLVALGFSFVHIVIFFVFLSTASFLGFRLSRQIRELEVVQGQQDSVTILRDFLYIPFVVVGRWMSEKYSRINVVAMILDMVIELPLKTVLHLIRQWGAFITSKKDEL